ncbi:MAG: DinB family protein [Rhodothermales bacterium]
MPQFLSERYVALYTQGRTRLTGWLDEVVDEDLSRRLHPEANTLGWMLRHIGEVELLFAKNIFGRDLDVHAQTIGPNAGRSQQFGGVEELRELLDRSGRELREAIAAQEEDDWTREVTADFGTLPLQEALARIVTHTAYHAGQAHLTLKYGTA